MYKNNKAQTAGQFSCSVNPYSSNMYL